MNLKNVA